MPVPGRVVPIELLRITLPVVVALSTWIPWNPLVATTLPSTMLSLAVKRRWMPLWRFAIPVVPFSARPTTLPWIVFPFVAVPPVFRSCRSIPSPWLPATTFAAAAETPPTVLLQAPRSRSIPSSVFGRLTTPVGSSPTRLPSTVLPQTTPVPPHPVLASSWIPSSWLPEATLAEPATVPQIVFDCAQAPSSIPAPAFPYGDGRTPFALTP